MLLNLPRSDLTGVRGQGKGDTKNELMRECETPREREGKKKNKVGVIHRDRLSGKARRVRGEDLLFMLERGQG